jgi:hypothetical protein
VSKNPKMQGKCPCMLSKKFEALSVVKADKKGFAGMVSSYILVALI